VKDQSRIVVTTAGTKTGKTFGLCLWLLENAWNTPQSLCWWTAPTLRQARIAYNYIGRWLPPHRVRANRTELAYYLLKSDGSIYSTIEFRSADNPESIRGDGVHFAVIDEAAYWKRDSYISVQTTLTRTRGKLRIISTPKGRNWFYEEWYKGWKDNPKRDPEYSSHALPTSSNPFIDPAMIEYARRNMPAESFRQEYLAEFLDESAGVFKGIRDCATSQLYDKPLPGHRYGIGIDWAKHEDYTVFTIGDLATRDIVHIQRYNDVDWNVNIDRAIRLAKLWNNAMVLMDSTGVGDVPFDTMRSVYPFTYGYSISTNERKKQLVQKLQFAIERKEIGIPDPQIHRDQAQRKQLSDTLIEELQMYSYRVTGMGVMQFSAPEGRHDDMVISLALANWIMCEQPQHMRARQVAGV
jgi:hypothetical protein